MKHLITENLPIWTTAPNGIKKLRELILELAVRGLLVPQDPNDEPASELLKKIAEEKARLVSEGKIKPSKPLPKISEGEKPFDLPIGWDWTRLGDITNYGYCDKAEPTEVDEQTWILDLEDVEKETSRLIQKIRFVEKPFKSSKNRFFTGDVIYGKLRPYLDKVLVADEPGVCTTEMIPVRGYCSIVPQFLRLVMKSPYFINYANNSTHGMNLPRLGTERAQLALIPLLSETEQHRIVTKVDELMQLCDQLEHKQNHNQQTHRQLVSTLLSTLTEASDAQVFQAAWSQIATNFACLFTTENSIEQLKQTILQLAVMGKLVPQDPNDEPASELLQKIATEKARLIAEGKIKKQNPLPKISEKEKPFGLPDSWEWVRISTFTQIGTGSTPSRGNPLYYSPSEISWVTSGETQQDFIFETREKISPLALKETNVSVYPIGSLVVAMYGQGKTRGQVSELMIEAGTNQACAVIQFIEQSEAHRKYIKLFYKKAYEELRSNSAGGAQPNLNVGKITLTVIPLPPLAEQHRIVAKVDELMALCEQLKTKLATAQSLQQQLAETLVQQAVA